MPQIFGAVGLTLTSHTQFPSTTVAQDLKFFFDKS